MAGPAMFMVTDELIVKPLSPISGISLLNGLNINNNDLEERFVKVGKEEVKQNNLPCYIKLYL